MTKGKLYIIATPIGNLEDMTARAVNILKDEIGVIYCEDTRQSRKLLTAYGIDKKIKSLHAHSPEARIDEACADMEQGISAAYMTDSGTPGISDPGNRLVKAARDRGLTVVPIPGPSALSTILSVSGFSERRVIFTGFLSKKGGKMRRELQELKEFQGVIVIYESPYRIKKLIRALYEIFPDNRIVIAREMTKLYEEFYTGTVAEIYENIDTVKEKGEFALALLNQISTREREGVSPDDPDDE